VSVNSLGKARDPLLTKEFSLKLATSELQFAAIKPNGNKANARARLRALRSFAMRILWNRKCTTSTT
jgi:hypothetical protein